MTKRRKGAGLRKVSLLEYTGYLSVDLYSEISVKLILSLRLEVTVIFYSCTWNVMCDITTMRLFSFILWKVITT